MKKIKSIIRFTTILTLSLLIIAGPFISSKAEAIFPDLDHHRKMQDYFDKLRKIGGLTIVPDFLDKDENNSYGDINYYQDPVDGEWKKIDNKLTKIEEESKYVNTANIFKAQFKEYNDGKDLLTIKDTDNMITINPVETNPVKSITGREVIKYNNIYGNADLKFKVQGNEVVGTLIIKNNTIENDSYLFELKLENLEPVTDVDNEYGITLVDSNGNQKWSINPALMIENNKVISFLETSIYKDKKKLYLEIKMDKDIISEIQYPVNIEFKLARYTD